MADAPDSAPAADTGRQKKCVLVPFGGKSQLDANRRLFEWCAVHLMDAADDVFVGGLRDGRIAVWAPART